jgi:hypothetical protein
MYARIPIWRDSNPISYAPEAIHMYQIIKKYLNKLYENLELIFYYSDEDCALAAWGAFPDPEWAPAVTSARITT